MLGDSRVVGYPDDAHIRAAHPRLPPRRARAMYVAAPNRTDAQLARGLHSKGVPAPGCGSAPVHVPWRSRARQLEVGTIWITGFCGQGCRRGRGEGGTHALDTHQSRGGAWPSGPCSQCSRLSPPPRQCPRPCPRTSGCPCQRAWRRHAMCVCASAGSQQLSVKLLTALIGSSPHVWSSHVLNIAQGGREPDTLTEYCTAPVHPYTHQDVKAPEGGV
jgi:hypothetical protein